MLSWRCLICIGGVRYEQHSTTTIRGNEKRKQWKTFLVFVWSVPVREINAKGKKEIRNPHIRPKADERDNTRNRETLAKPGPQIRNRATWKLASSQPTDDRPIARFHVPSSLYIDVQTGIQ